MPNPQNTFWGVMLAKMKTELTIVFIHQPISVASKSCRYAHCVDVYGAWVWNLVGHEAGKEIENKLSLQAMQSDKATRGRFRGRVEVTPFREKSVFFVWPKNNIQPITNLETCLLPIGNSWFEHWRQLNSLWHWTHPRHQRQHQELWLQNLYNQLWLRKWFPRAESICL